MGGKRYDYKMQQLNLTYKFFSLLGIFFIFYLINYYSYSPVYIDSTANIQIAAKRVLWGKYINAGQTCIAPDYILCSTEVQNKFVTEAKKILKEWYGENPKESPDFCRIINENHFQ